MARELAGYGLSVMSAWVSTGVIASKCWEKGRPVDLPHDWTTEDREDLVVEVIAHGVETFRQALLADRWKPEKGASLRTYYLGGCVLAFPNVLRQWRNDRRRYYQAATAWARESPTHQQVVEPTDLVDAVDALESLTRDKSERERAIRCLVFDGYTPAEIAEILAMTPGAVNTALYRMRRHGPGSAGRLR